MTNKKKWLNRELHKLKNFDKVERMFRKRKKRRGLKYKKKYD